MPKIHCCDTKSETNKLVCLCRVICYLRKLKSYLKKDKAHNVEPINIGNQTKSIAKRLLEYFENSNCLYRDISGVVSIYGMKSYSNDTCNRNVSHLKEVEKVKNEDFLDFVANMENQLYENCEQVKKLISITDCLLEHYLAEKLAIAIHLGCVIQLPPCDSDGDSDNDSDSDSDSDGGNGGPRPCVWQFNVAPSGSIDNFKIYQGTNESILCVTFGTSSTSNALTGTYYIVLDTTDGSKGKFESAIIQSGAGRFFAVLDVCEVCVKNVGTIPNDGTSGTPISQGELFNIKKGNEVFDPCVTQLQTIIIDDNGIYQLSDPGCES